ncbi:hypothetical protein LINPERHAP1_LOCUS4877 [Linum perenne]
MRKRIGTWL